MLSLMHTRAKLPNGRMRMCVMDSLDIVYFGFSVFFPTFDVVTDFGMDVLLKDRLSLDFLRYDFWAGSSIDTDMLVVILIKDQYIIDVTVLHCT